MSGDERQAHINAPACPTAGTAIACESDRAGCSHDLDHQGGERNSDIVALLLGREDLEC